MRPSLSATSCAVVLISCVLSGCGKSAAESQKLERCRSSRKVIVDDLRSAHSSLSEDYRKKLPEELEASSGVADGATLSRAEQGLTAFHTIQVANRKAEVVAYRHRRELIEPTQKAIDDATAAWSSEQSSRELLKSTTTTLLDKFDGYERALSGYMQRIELSRGEVSALLDRLNAWQAAPDAAKDPGDARLLGGIIKTVQIQLEGDDAMLSTQPLLGKRFEIERTALASYDKTCL